MTTVEIDDGSEILTVYGFSSEFNLLGVDPPEWESIGPNVQNEIISNFIGLEFVFFLTRANPLDFNMNEIEKKGQIIWRVDTFSEGKEETKRTVRYLIDILQPDSNEEYQVGSCGKLPFLFPPSTH